MSKKKIDLEYLFCVKDGCVTYGLYRKVQKKIQGKDVIMIRNSMGHELSERYFKKSLTDREKKIMVKLYRELDIEDVKLRAFKDGDIKEAAPEIRKLKSMDVEEYYSKIIEEVHFRNSYLFEDPHNIENTNYLLKSEQE